jgi:hypothetical protein
VALTIVFRRRRLEGRNVWVPKVPGDSEGQSMIRIAIGFFVISALTIAGQETASRPPADSTVTIAGSVNKPGVYSLFTHGRQITVLMAIDQAGGLSDHADTDVYILRSSRSDRASNSGMRAKIPVSLSDIRNGKVPDISLRGDWKGLLDPEDREVNLPGHAILDRGRLIGRWEFDTETGTIAWASFVPRDKALEKAVREMEAFVREDLGDARSFSLDSAKSRVPRIEKLRAMAIG